MAGTQWSRHFYALSMRERVVISQLPFLFACVVLAAEIAVHDASALAAPTMVAAGAITVAELLISVVIPWRAAHEPWWIAIIASQFPIVALAGTGAGRFTASIALLAVAPAAWLLIGMRRGGVLTATSGSVMTVSWLIGQNPQAFVDRPFPTVLLPLYLVFAAAVAARVLARGRLAQAEELRVLAEQRQALLDRSDAQVADLNTAIAARDSYVSMIGHELRTPMTAVIGYLELILEDPGLPDDLRSKLRIVLHNAERVTRMSTEMLDTSGRGVSARFAPHDLGEIARDSVRAFAAMAKQQGVQLSCEIDEPLELRVDASAIRRMFDNLISNAVKYSPDGGHVRIAGRTDGERLRITVTDEGIGMSEEAVRRMFSRFYRSPDAEARGIEGAGLGMSLVRLVVDAHGGDIAVQSAPGRGTSIRVSLPALARVHSG